jgi:DNA-binding MarR family transcriptional regulator
MACGSTYCCTQHGHCLVKKLKQKRMLILRYVANNYALSESSILQCISNESGIPLSTLKLNIKMLHDFGLVRRAEIGAPILLTKSGKQIFNAIPKGSAYKK